MRADDYEPWLAEMIRRGEIEPPDEYVIESGFDGPAGVDSGANVSGPAELELPGPGHREDDSQ